MGSHSTRDHVEDNICWFEEDKSQLRPNDQHEKSDTAWAFVGTGKGLGRTAVFSERRNSSKTELTASANSHHSYQDIQSRVEKAQLFIRVFRWDSILVRGEREGWMELWVTSLEDSQKGPETRMIFCSARCHSVGNAGPAPQGNKSWKTWHSRAIITFFIVVLCDNEECTKEQIAVSKEVS